MTATTTTPARGDGAQHRHGCTRPGYTVQQSQALPAWQIIRCADCQAPTLTPTRTPEARR